MDRNSGVVSEKLFNPRSLVCGEIIANDVNFFAFGLMGYDVSKKGDKLCAGVPCCGFAQYAPSLSVKGSVQGERAVAVVLITVTFGPSGRLAPALDQDGQVPESPSFRPHKKPPHGKAD